MRPGKSALLADIGVSPIMAQAAGESVDTQPRRIFFFLCMACQAAGGEIRLTREEMDAFTAQGRFDIRGTPDGSVVARWMPEPQAPGDPDRPETRVVPDAAMPFGAPAVALETPEPSGHHTAHRAAFEREAI